MRVFISSVIEGFKPWRDAAAKAIKIAGFTPVMSEHFGSPPYSSELACRTEVEQSEIYVLIMGARYGFEPTPGLSVTQQEFRYAVSRHKDILVFIDNSQPMEPSQATFRREVENFQSGFHRSLVDSPEDFKDSLASELVKLKNMRAACTQEDFESRVTSAAGNSRQWTQRSDRPAVTIAFLPQPSRSIDITLLEKNVDGLFSKSITSGLAKLQSGYDLIAESNATGFKSKGTEVRCFDDGLVTMQSEISSPKQELYSVGDHVSPSMVAQIAKACWPLFDGSSGWCRIGVKGMEYKLMQEPPTERRSSFSVPMHDKSEQHICKLLIPCSAPSYDAWIDETVRRFVRIFGSSR